MLLIEFSPVNYKHIAYSTRSLMKIPCCAKKLIATFFSSYDRKLDRKLTMLSLKLNDLKIKNEVEKKGK